MVKVTVIIPVYNQENLVIRAIESIPKRDDIEIMVIDDGSTDDTWNNLIEYRKRHPNIMNLILLYNEENKGVGYTVNRGYNNAKGEYITLLGSDDYFNTEEFEKILDKLDGTDMVYYDLQINDGTIFHLSPETKQKYCGSTKFIKKAFLGNTRNPERRVREDFFFYQELIKKNPTEKFTGMVVKNYNFPREGSLTDLACKGAIDV